jgi:hypothetical protein
VGKKGNSDTSPPVPITSPLDITTMCKLDGSTIDLVMTWPRGTSKKHGVGIYLGKPLTSELAIKNLKSNPAYTRKSNVTLEMVRKKYEMTAEICLEPILLSLCCPITKQRLKVPCVGSACDHINCFDGRSFLEMNRSKRSWSCPICSKKIGFNELLSDELTHNIVTKTHEDCLRVEFDRKGGWIPLEETPAAPAKSSKTSTSHAQDSDIIVLDSSDDEEPKKN